MHLRSAIALITLAATLSCGGKGDPSQEAIASLMVKLRASVLSGAQALDPSLFETPPQGDLAYNPAAHPSDGSKSVTLAGAANDGTAGLEVTVANKFIANVDGSGTAQTTVTEKGTGFKFLDYTVNVKKPEIAHRIPKGGLSALKADGTGQAFVILSIGTSGTITRTFNNVSASGKKLIAFTDGPEPAAGTATAEGRGANEMLMEVKLAKVNGKIEARLGTQQVPYSMKLRFARAGGPAQADAEVVFSKARVGSADAVASDFLVPIGKDFAPSGGQAANAPVEIAFNATGGASGQGTGYFGMLEGPFNPPFAELPEKTATYQSALSGMDRVDDGTVQIDKPIVISAMSGEFVPEMEHSIGMEDTLILDVGTAAYLSAMGGAIRSIILLR